MFRKRGSLATITLVMTLAMGAAAPAIVALGAALGDVGLGGVALADASLGEADPGGMDMAGTDLGGVNTGGMDPKEVAGAKDLGNMPRETVVDGANAFAFDLYAKLKEQPGNLFFSPYSISTALAMTYAGARGRTAEQMAEVLRFELPQDRLHPTLGALIRDLNSSAKAGSYALTVANALWGQSGYEFLKSYLELTRTHYGGGLREVDFAGNTEESRLTINLWVEEETNEKITDLIGPGVLSKETRLVLTNAIYFKAAWNSPFREGNTRDAAFTLIGGSRLNVAMMNQTDSFWYAEDDDCQVLQLPYKGQDLAMLILLPKKVDGLPELEETLTHEKLAAWVSKIRRRRVDASIPKFKTTKEIDLAYFLMSMGMADAFSVGAADFSGMTGRKDLFISAVLHKAFVDVDEQGTEAAAATAVVMPLACAPEREEPLVFCADHPFLFLIRHMGTNSILFMGRITDPKS